MSAQLIDLDRVAELRRELQDAVCGFRLDDAENIYTEMIDQCGVDPDSDDMLPPRVMLGIFDGRVRDMLLMLNDLGEDRALGLKAVCLQILDDPLWEGMALHVQETSPDAAIRRSMESLLEARDN